MTSVGWIETSTFSVQFSRTKSYVSKDDDDLPFPPLT